MPQEHNIGLLISNGTREKKNKKKKSTVIDCSVNDIETGLFPLERLT